MAEITVLNTNDAGAGSLRQAILDASAGDTISFDPSLAGQTITLTTGQLVLDKDLIINGDIDGDRKADIAISGNDATRIFEITGSGTDVALRSLILTDGNAGGGTGGAIWAGSGTTLAVIDSTISDSEADDGGGVYATGATLRVVNSTITGNGAHFWGAGLRLVESTATLVNTTLHDNTAGGGGGGGAIDASVDSVLTILNSTIAGNTSTGGSSAGGLYASPSTTITIRNSVIAGNTGADGDIEAFNMTAGSSFFGTTADIGTDEGGNINGGGDPGLGALANNGGPVETRIPLAGSPLIGAGNAALLPDDDFDLDSDSDTGEDLPLDSIGNVRVLDGIDIGAVEFFSGAPRLTDLTSSVTFLENTVNAAPQLLDTSVTFTDPDNNFDGGTLTVSGLLAEDAVSIRNQGTGAGQIGISGSNVSFGGTVIGTLAGGNAGTTLAVTFNASATAAAIDALIQNLTYANASDTPTASRTLTVTVTDSAGAPTTRPSYVEQADAANPFNGVDVGFYSAPVIADLDGDGDLDVAVGENDGTVNYFLNTGSASAPVFAQQNGAANPFNGIDVGVNATLGLADLDGDGDLDAVMGSNAGTLRYFENTGSASAASFTERTGILNPFDAIVPGHRGTPTFGDLDGDGDLDMVVGQQYGTLTFYENTGSTAAPAFVQQTGTSNPFDGIDVGFYAKPTLVDLDGDGDLDAVVGNRYGFVRAFENTGTATAPVFVELTGTANPFDSIVKDSQSTPALGDLDGDGDPDLLVGGNSGQLFTFLNTTPAGVQVVVNVTEENDIGVTIVGSKKADLVDAINTVAGQPLPTNNDDTIFGNRGDDDLSGLLGDDTINGGKGKDILRGGGGNDILQVKGEEGTRDIFEGGLGTDTLQFIGGNQVTLRGFDASASSIEILQGNGKGLKGTSAADSFDFSGLTSMSAVAFVDGNRGDDTLIGSVFADDLRGGKGADRLDGGGGADLLEGGRGVDTFVFADGYGADTVLDYEAGKDIIDLTGVAGVNAFGDLLLTQIDNKTVLIDFDGVLGGDTLTVQKTTIAQLTANQGDFLF